MTVLAGQSPDTSTPGTGLRDRAARRLARCDPEQMRHRAVVIGAQAQALMAFAGQVAGTIATLTFEGPVADQMRLHLGETYKATVTTANRIQSLAAHIVRAAGLTQGAGFTEAAQSQSKGAVIEQHLHQAADRNVMPRIVLDMKQAQCVADRLLSAPGVCREIALRLRADGTAGMSPPLAVHVIDELAQIQAALLCHGQRLALEGAMLRAHAFLLAADDTGTFAPASVSGSCAHDASLAQRAGVLPSGVVTFLLTDIESSTRLWDANGDAMAAALELHDELIARLATRHGGRLLKDKGEGDATLSVFHRASDAVTCAAELQRALSTAWWPAELELRVRIAVHSGEAQERDGDYFGPVLNRAARLRTLATSGVTLLSQSTAELVRDHLPGELTLIDVGRHELRGLSRPERVYELRTRTDASAATIATWRQPVLLSLRRSLHAPTGSSFAAATSSSRGLCSALDSAACGAHSSHPEQTAERARPNRDPMP